MPRILGTRVLDLLPPLCNSLNTQTHKPRRRAIVANTGPHLGRAQKGERDVTPSDPEVHNSPLQTVTYPPPAGVLHSTYPNPASYAENNSS